VIDLSKAISKTYMACNNIVLTDRTVVVPGEEALDFVADPLAKQGFEVIRLPYRVPCMVGGSFRCAHQPLVRR